MSVLLQDFLHGHRWPLIRFLQPLNNLFEVAHRTVQYLLHTVIGLVEDQLHLVFVDLALLLKVAKVG